MKTEIKYRQTAGLKPHPNNPRKAKENGVQDLAQSIADNPNYFEARPILLSDRTGELVIIGGERRWEAAKYLQMEEVPTILLSGLTEEKEKEILIKDNTHSGIWNADILKGWNLVQLKKWDVPLDVIQDVNKKAQSDFEKKFNEYNNSNCDFPIVPVADEKYEMFIIFSDNETDSNWLREKLGMSKMKSYKSDEIAKSNVISINDLKNVL